METFFCKAILVGLIWLLSRIILDEFVVRSHIAIRRFIVAKRDKSDKEQDAERQARLVEMRDKELSWITHLVGTVELIVFVCLFVVLLINDPKLGTFEIAKYYVTFLGGWLGIKVLSSHGPWSNFIAGKAYYHILLVGTLLNVGTAMIIGWIFTR